MAALAAVLAFRALTFLVFTAGTAALAAALAATPLVAQTGLRWATAIPRSGALIGLIFFGGSIASTRLMPRNAAILRRIPPSSERLPPAVLLIAIAWCIAAVWQLPALAEWFQDNAVAVRALVGTGPDPLGLNLVPATIAYALPALTALALAGFVLGAVLVVACRPAVAFRVIAACAVLQGALVAGEYLVRVDTARVLDGLLTALQPHGVPTARVAAWLTDNDAMARAFELRLIVMFAAAVAASIFSRTGVRAAVTTQDPAPAADVAPIGTPVEMRPQPSVLPGRESRPTTGHSPFEESNYSVRPRVSLNPFVRRYSTYDIASIPPMSSSRCTFSWDTGKLIRAGDGAVLLAIAPTVAPGLFFDKTYTVSDAAGVPLGRLVPNAADWSIEDASSGRRVDVLRQHASVAFARFDALTDGRELCRFTWTFQATVLSAEMEIEFKPDADPALRLLAVALAPILELRSRLISERQNTPDV